MMPNITIDKLERFVQALIESRARAACQATSQIAASARDTEAQLEAPPQSVFANGTPNGVSNGTS